MMYSEYPIEAAGTLMRRVFGWMTFGLALTGLTAYGLAYVPTVQMAIVHNPVIFIVLMLAQFGLVIYLSLGLARMSRETAVFCYVLYSLLTGVTFSTLFMAFTLPSLAITFFICSGMFAVMAIYGMVTKSDLSGLGSFLIMGLVGLIIASLINMFLKSAQMDFVVSIIGVIIFTVFTAYDVQMVKRMGMTMLANEEEMTKVSIISALKLYLDFVNLFLYLLRFFGQRKD